MDQIVPIINALSSLLIVLAFTYIVACAGIDRILTVKKLSMEAIAKKVHVDFCEEFGYNMNTPVSAATVRDILHSLAEGHDPIMAYLRSADAVFNKDKING